MIMLKWIAPVCGVVALFCCAVYLHADGTSAPASQPAPKLEKVGDKATTADGLTLIETGVGEPGAQNGDIVWVNYTGTLKDGTKFDSSLDHPDAEPIRFTLGQGQVIKGWDEGIKGMKVGEKRTLVIPASLGYGAAGSPPKIPGNSELHFDVELVGMARVGKH
jgi:FKBP-type peptidyl-prolyl cis-trans isomerase